MLFLHLKIPVPAESVQYVKMQEKIYRLCGTLLLAVSIFLAVACTAAPSGLYGAASAGAPLAADNAKTAELAPLQTAAITVSAYKWALWTGGTQLRGANVYQRRVYTELDGADFMGPGPVGPPFTRQDFDNLAALGANYVNLSHPGLFTETAPFTLDMDIQNNLDDLLAKAAQADLFAVISFRTGPGRSEFTFFWDEAGDWFSPDYLNDSLWQDQAAQDAWVEMWRYTAQRYKNNPIVVGYDLMVEPNSNEVGSSVITDRLDIWDPDEFYARHGNSLYDWNQLYPRIVAAIRQVDPDTPILIGGMGYSAVDWLPYMKILTNARTVYMVHQYAPFIYTHQASDTTTCAYPGNQCDLDDDGVNDLLNKAWLENSVFSITNAFSNAHSVPVAANEFGLMRWEPGADRFMDDQMDLMEARGMNYALWEWTPVWEPYQIYNDFNFRHGPDPNNHTDVASALSATIVSYWGRNTIRPSSVLTFTPVATIYLPLIFKQSSAVSFQFR